MHGPQFILKEGCAVDQAPKIPQNPLPPLVTCSGLFLHESAQSLSDCKLLRAEICHTGRAKRSVAQTRTRSLLSEGQLWVKCDRLIDSSCFDRTATAFRLTRPCPALPGTGPASSLSRAVLLCQLCDAVSLPAAITQGGEGKRCFSPARKRPRLVAWV